MLKSELIAALSDPDLPDVEVLVSRDEEGNGFNVLYEIAFYGKDDDPDDLPFAFEEAGFDQAIVLWP
jgi:hypothetical protein